MTTIKVGQHVETLSGTFGVIRKIFASGSHFVLQINSTDLLVLSVLEIKKVFNLLENYTVKWDKRHGL